MPTNRTYNTHAPRTSLSRQACVCVCGDDAHCVNQAWIASSPHSRACASVKTLVAIAIPLPDCCGCLPSLSSAGRTPVCFLQASETARPSRGSSAGLSLRYLSIVARETAVHHSALSGTCGADETPRRGPLLFGRCIGCEQREREQPVRPKKLGGPKTGGSISTFGRIARILFGFICLPVNIQNRTPRPATASS